MNLDRPASHDGALDRAVDPRGRRGALDAGVVAKAELCLLDMIGIAAAAKRSPVEPAGGAVRRGHGRQPRDADRLAGARERRGGRVRERDGGARTRAGGHAHRERVAHRRRRLADARSRSRKCSARPAARSSRPGVIGYQVMARIGQALITKEVAQRFRPTGLVGAVGAAAAGARLLRLSEDETVNALALAANTAGGLNEWPRSGGGEMFFHPGFAARNAVTARAARALRAPRRPSRRSTGAAGLFAAFGGVRALRRSSSAATGRSSPRITSPFRPAITRRRPAQAALAVRSARPDLAARHRASGGAELPRGDRLPGLRPRRPVPHAAPGEDEHPVHRRCGAGPRPARRRGVPGVRGRRRGGGARAARAARERRRARARLPAAAGRGGDRDAAGRAVPSAGGSLELEPLDAAGVRRRTRAALAGVLGDARAAEVEREIDAITASPDAARHRAAARPRLRRPAVATMPVSRTIPDLIDELARRFPEREALVGSGQRYTYRELRAEVRRIARGLAALGVRRGDKVAILMGNRPEWLIADFAITLLGGVMVGVNTWATARELEYVLGHSDTRFLITADRFLKYDYRALLAGLRLPLLERIVGAGRRRCPPAGCGMPTSASLGAPVPDAAIDAAQRAVRPDDVAYLLYTSGSTSLPKGVQLQHYALIENMWQIGERQQVTEHDRLWLAVSLFWGLGCENALFNVMTHAGCVVLQEHFDAGEALALIERERCTLFYGTPNMAQALHEHPDRTRARPVEPARRRDHRHARADHARRRARRARGLQHLRPHRDVRQLQRRRRRRSAREAAGERRAAARRRRSADRRPGDGQGAPAGRGGRGPGEGLRDVRLLQGPGAHRRIVRRARVLQDRRSRRRRRRRQSPLPRTHQGDGQDRRHQRRAGGGGGGLDVAIPACTPRSSPACRTRSATRCSPR